MRTDLTTSIVTAIVGFILAFLVTGLLTGKIEPVTIKTIDSNASADFAEPNPEIFNYKALNPTVEVYVGDCQRYDQYGNCLDNTNVNSSSRSGGN